MMGKLISTQNYAVPYKSRVLYSGGSDMVLPPFVLSEYIITYLNFGIFSQRLKLEKFKINGIVLAESVMKTDLG